MTLSVVFGGNSAAHAGERIMDVEAPGFRGASLVGAIIVIPVFIGVVAFGDPIPASRTSTCAGTRRVKLADRTSTLPRAASDKRAETGQRTPDDQRIHLPRAFV